MSRAIKSKVLDVTLYYALNFSPNGGSYVITLYYVLNLQGDVVALMQLVEEDDGSLRYHIIANYTYNAWGELISITDKDGNAITNANNIGVLNPIRYRGYYYDAETGFYYLQSRYYDPATHRFINADGYASTGQGFIGTNMFAYCNNSPVTYSDFAGEYCTYSVCETDTGDATYEMEMKYEFLHYAWKNGISIYYSMDAAASAWAKENRPLSKTKERMAYIYNYYNYYYLSDTYVGVGDWGPFQANVIGPTLFIEAKTHFLPEYGTNVAQIHTHPQEKPGKHCDFPSEVKGIYGGDRIAFELFGYEEMYVIPYERCPGTPEIIKYTDRSTWCRGYNPGG